MAIQIPVHNIFVERLYHGAVSIVSSISAVNILVERLYHGAVSIHVVRYLS